MKVSLRILILVIFSIFSLFSSGCAKDAQETEKKIIEFDPSFKESLEKRNALRKAVFEQKDQYAQKKAKIEEQVRMLRAKNIELSRQSALVIENIQQQLEPERRQLQRKIIELKREYDKILASLSEINKDIREISKLVEKKEDLSLTQEELSTWNDRLATLMKRRTLKESERIDLQQEISVSKMKLKVMKL